MNLEALRARLAEIETEHRNIHQAAGDGDLTPEQTTHWEALETEQAQVRADIATAEEAEARAARIAESRKALGSLSMGGPEVIIRKNPFENVAELRFDKGARYAPDIDDDAVIISRAVSAFTDKETRQRGVSDEHLATLVDKIEHVPGVARHALIHGSPEYRSGFKTYLKSKGMSPLYSAGEADAVRAAMALGGSTGGYTLPTLLDPTLIHTGTATKNPIRSIARVISGTQNVWHGVSVGNVTTYWHAEAAAMTEGSPTFSNPSVTAQMLTAYLTASYEIFEDSDLQAQLPGLIGEAFSYKEGTAFVSGAAGSNQPNGVVTAISATAGDTVTCTTRGSFTSASAVDVFALVAAVPSRYEDSVTWVANKSWFNVVRQMSTGSQGSYFWTDFNGGGAIGAAGQKPLLGAPVVQASDMNTSFASGSVIAILGDFSQYVIYDRIGTSVEFMQNVVDGSGLPTGQRGLVAHKRVGADVTDLGAFRFLKA